MKALSGSVPFGQSAKVVEVAEHQVADLYVFEFFLQDGMALQIELDVVLKLLGVFELFRLQRREALQKIEKEFRHRLLLLRRPVREKPRKRLELFAYLYQTLIQTTLPAVIASQGYTYTVPGGEADVYGLCIARNTTNEKEYHGL